MKTKKQSNEKIKYLMVSNPVGRSIWHGELKDLPKNIEEDLKSGQAMGTLCAVPKATLEFCLEQYKVRPIHITHIINGQTKCIEELCLGDYL